MTNDDLDLTVLAGLLERATPGPWEARRNKAGNPTVGPEDSYGNITPWIARGEDAAFIAAARTAVPRLMDQVIGLEAGYSWTQRELQRVMDERDELLTRLATREAELERLEENLRQCVVTGKLLRDGAADREAEVTRLREVETAARSLVIVKDHNDCDPADCGYKRLLVAMAPPTTATEETGG